MNHHLTRAIIDNAIEVPGPPKKFLYRDELGQYIGPPISIPTDKNLVAIEISESVSANGLHQIIRVKDFF